MPITLPDEYKTNDSLFNKQDNDYVSLPFPYLRLNWNNGNRRDAKENGAMHYGGWQRGVEDIQTDLNAMSQTVLPAGFTDAVEWISDDSTTYMAHSIRSLYLAPILAKVDWGMITDRRTQQKKKLHTCDLLCYLASLENKALVPWGMAVITSKNYVATSVETALRNFAKETAEARKLYAGGMDSRFFYHSIGTFGPTRADVKVEGGAVYVPVQLNPPKSGWNEEALTWCFVGETVAAIMISARKEAEEWGKDTREAREKNRKPSAEPDIQFGSIGPENFTDEPPF